MIKRALFSLSDPSASDALAVELHEQGCEIIASDETVEYLKDRFGIAAIPVQTFVGIECDYPFPPTLHPKMELALTGDDPAVRIDLVFDQPYGFDQGLDIGGHTLIGLAVKGQRYVVTDRAEAKLLACALEDKDLVGVQETLQARAVVRLATFYNDIAARHGQRLDLENGENPYQTPAYQISQSDDLMDLGRFENLSQTKPCFTNVADLDCNINLMIALAKSFALNFGRVPAIAIAAKHGNACGVGISWSDPQAALDGALWGEPQGIWGGEVIVNFPVSEQLADQLIRSKKREETFGNERWMLDIIAAPAYEGDAREMLLQRKFCKLYVNADLVNPERADIHPHQRAVRGGYLMQPAHDYCLELPKGKFSDEDSVDMIVSWGVAFWSFHGGNEVALAKDGRLISVGGGPSTVTAVKTAIDRAQESGHDTQGSLFAADAFFPFTDAPERLVAAGCKGGSVPAGGLRFKDVETYFVEHDVECYYLAEDIRGFCRH